MKRILLSAITILFYHSVVAQDTIIKYSGDIIRAKVIEISPTEVKYKKFDFQEGPTYVDKKSEIQEIKFVNGLKEHFERTTSQTTSNNNNTQTSVDYYGGPNQVPLNTDKKISEFGRRYRYNNGLLSEREVQNVLMNTKDKHIMGLVQQSKQAQGLQYIGFGGIVCGMIAYVCLIEAAGAFSTYGNTPSRSKQNSYLGAAAAFTVIGIACPIVSGVYKHKRREYNREAIDLYNQKY